jgi:branched-subunit amino acid aminotransferase/4-amino-4-deoxychorismate lyase
VIGPYFVRNGALLPVDQAVVPIDDVNFAYGFGVYETLKIRNRILFFPERHEQRLFESARIIGVEHPFREGEITDAICRLARANGKESVNVKILLVGGSVSGGAAEARCDIMLLPPLFPDRRLYRDGVAAITVDAERQYPASKSLSMTVSTMAFRAAVRAGAYDALLVNRHGQVTEGTRTNVYALRDGAVVTPPLGQCLDGVTRETLLEVLTDTGVEVVEEPLSRAWILHAGAGTTPGGGEGAAAGEHTAAGSAACDGVFLSSTSTKVVPVSRIDGEELPIAPLFRDIANSYNDYLRNYAARQNPLW